MTILEFSIDRTNLTNIRKTLDVHSELSEVFRISIVENILSVMSIDIFDRTVSVSSFQNVKTNASADFSHKNSIKTKTFMSLIKGINRSCKCQLSEDAFIVDGIDISKECYVHLDHIVYPDTKTVLTKVRTPEYIRLCAVDFGTMLLHSALGAGITNFSVKHASGATCKLVLDTTFEVGNIRIEKNVKPTFIMNASIDVIIKFTKNISNLLLNNEYCKVFLTDDHLAIVTGDLASSFVFVYSNKQAVVS